MLLNNKSVFVMKSIVITATILTSFNLFSQAIPSKESDSKIKSQDHKSLVRGVDISKASPNEQGLIHYMETLTEKETLEFLKSFVDGEIVFKETKENEIKH